MSVSLYLFGEPWQPVLFTKQKVTVVKLQNIEQICTRSKHLVKLYLFFLTCKYFSDRC